MLVAQVNQFGVAPGEVGILLAGLLTLILGGGGVIWAINQWRIMTRPKKKRSAGFITRGEHEETERKILARIDRHEEDTRKWRDEMVFGMNTINVVIAKIATKMGIKDHAD